MMHLSVAEAQELVGDEVSITSYGDSRPTQSDNII
jgi:hypothetical protein